MSAAQLRFVLTEESLRNALHFYGNKDGTIQIGNGNIKLNKEIAIFVSTTLYLHFRCFNEPYSIDLSEYMDNSEKEVAKCASKFISLAEGKENCQIEEKELALMTIICDEMGNKWLEKQLESPNEKGWPIIFRWTSEFLKEFYFLPNRKEFRFEVCGKAFSCPKILALLLSKDLCRRVMTDSSISSQQLTLPDGFDRRTYLDAFENVFNLISGSPLVISIEKVKIFKEIAKEIGCEELLTAIEGFDWGPIDISNVYEYLSFLHIGDQSKRYSEAIEFAAANFYQLKEENLLAIPVRTIENILSSPQLRIENEGKLFEFAKKFIGNSKESGIGIISKVKIEYLDSRAMNEMIEMVNLDSMSKEVWTAISKRLKYEVDYEENSAESKRWVSQGKSAIEILRIENEALKTEVKTLKQRIEEFGNQQRAQKQMEEIMKKEIEILMKFLLQVNGNIVVKLNSKEYNGPIEIPEGITRIEKEAFKESKISSVRLPTTLIEICESAFQDCSSLSLITIPSSVTQIGKSAFCGCHSVSSITISSSVTQICGNVFYGCSSLSSITIPSSVTQIGESAFRGCSSLSSITIPSSVTQIGNCAFLDCSSLSSVTISSSVTQIGAGAFRRCSSLSSITIPSSVTQIGDYAFKECSSLRSITIPQNCRMTEGGYLSFDSHTKVVRK